VNTSPPRTLKLTLQYDGSRFVGWQRQENGLSIQALVEDALALIEGRPVSVTGASRTDAGVHALGQVASVTLTHGIDAADLQRALNATLPPDVRVTHVAGVATDFHARFSARGKTYRYRLFTGGLSPFERQYGWSVPRGLNSNSMRAAAGALIGRHDFAAFRSAGSDTRTTVRTIYAVDLQETVADSAIWPWGPSGDAPLINIEISGDGFLRHMVRTIVGTLVEIGEGRRSVEDMARVLAAGSRAAAGPTAPATGLFLVRVEY
jgi:tRNA pseudouridine38-40 synthase